MQVQRRKVERERIMPKDVNFSASERPSKVLVSLEDFTSLRGEELLQRIYLLVLGYDFEKLELREPDEDDVEGSPPVGSPPQATEKEITEFKVKKRTAGRLIPLTATPININIPSPRKKNVKDINNGKTIVYRNNVNDFFFAWYTPLKLAQKGRRCLFQDGLPLYYGKPGRQTSLYVAVLEVPHHVNKGPRQVWGAYKFQTGSEKATPPIDKGMIREPPSNSIYESVNNLEEEMKKAIDAFQIIDEKQEEIDYLPTILSANYFESREKEISAQYRTVRCSFSGLVNAFETIALGNDQEIRYSNVFTFREHDEWLEGGHRDWGDHRMALTIKVNVAD